MAKSQSQIDVLVLGEHPSAYLAAMLVAFNSKLRVVHSTVPGQAEPDRLVLINPAFFDLHPLLGNLRRKLEMTAVYGLQFLSDDAVTRSEFHSKPALAYVVAYKALRAAMLKLAQDQGLRMVMPRSMEIHGPDETGIDVALGKDSFRPRALIVGSHLPAADRKMLGMPDAWGADVVHRYTFLKLPLNRGIDLGSRPIIPMSLNLRDSFCWGWLMPGPRCTQLAVEQPIETVGSVRPLELLRHWTEVLRSHSVLSGNGSLPFDSAESMDLPFAGALEHEGVANRTLLIGPAGGFYSACAEDIYPNCWSTLFAADAIRKALREPHLQDALQPYRQKWRTTLGEYLRGPQQNLRFLLPLVYRNQKMTTRLTEAILQGRSVIR
jgi:hypothetical protein